ncbi:MAG: hypothetical protein R6V85_20790 [Polyangia bacterium]
MFRIEKSATMRASIMAFLSFLEWTKKAGAQQESLKRALKVWFFKAQKPGKIIAEGDAIERMPLEELEPMLSERIRKWQDELVAQGREEGEARGLSRGREQGVEEARRRLAARMLASGMPIAEVASLTDLDEDTLRSLSVD